MQEMTGMWSGANFVSSRVSPAIHGGVRRGAEGSSGEASSAFKNSTLWFCSLFTRPELGMKAALAV